MGVEAERSGRSAGQVRSVLWIWGRARRRRRRVERWEAVVRESAGRREGVSRMRKTFLLLLVFVWC